MAGTETSCSNELELMTGSTHNNTCEKRNIKDTDWRSEKYMQYTRESNQTNNPNYRATYRKQFHSCELQRDWIQGMEI